MRKCTARAWVRAVPPERIGTWVDVLGVFHQFGAGYEDLDDGGAGNVTTAIVEDIEGQVWECAINSLRFLKDDE